VFRGKVWQINRLV